MIEKELIEETYKVIERGRIDGISEEDIAQLYQPYIVAEREKARREERERIIEYMNINFSTLPPGWETCLP